MYVNITKMNLHDSAVELLFALEDYTIRFGNKVACTSKVCEWNKGSNKREPIGIMKRKYNNVKHPIDRYEFVPVKITEPPTVLINNLLSSCEGHGPLNNWRLIFNYHYEDYILSNDRKQELVTYPSKLFENLKYGNEPTEVSNTGGQNLNENWCNVRKFFITASMANYEKKHKVY